MPKKKRVKYNAGGQRELKFTQKLGKNVKLDLSINPNEYRGSVQTSKVFVSARGPAISEPPSQVTAGAYIPRTGAIVSGSYDFQSEQPSVAVTKPLSKTSYVKIDYGPNGVRGMYTKNFLFGK